MQNRKYFPFERNNYYFGKLLTAKDFEAEQRYFNDKRRLSNRLLGGNGIVSGLGVVMADDASVILQAGCAYDAGGREIVVPETQVVKLSAVEGYSQLISSCAYLGISYEEQPAEEVYGAMSNQEDGTCFNKTREGFKLCLLDESMAARIPSPADEFVTRMSIYADSEVELLQVVPKYVTRNSLVAVTVELVRIGHGSSEYSFCYTLETPGFENDKNFSETEISENHIRLNLGEKKTFHFTFAPQEHIWGGNSSVAFTVSGLKVQKNDETFSVNEKLEALLRPVQQNITQLCLSNWYGKAMDKQLSESYDQRLWIARLNLIRQNTKIIIDSVGPAPFGQYCYNPQQLMLLHELEQFYPGAAAAAAETSAGAAQSVRTPAASQQGAAQVSACGVFELPLGLGYDIKEPIFSEEIMHGLGREPVYVEVGVEYVTSDAKKGDSSEIVLGNAEIFGHYGKKDPNVLYNVSTAVKVLPERGTFIVGVKLGEATNLISLRLRWYAIRLSDVSKRMTARSDGEKYILVNPDTIVLPPKGTTHITPVFINMPSEACTYRLTDAEGGTIDNNGVYTAPAKEGVYEVRIETISDPNVYTHAFVIVSQKKKE